MKFRSLIAAAAAVALIPLAAVATPAAADSGTAHLDLSGLPARIQLPTWTHTKSVSFNLTIVGDPGQTYFVDNPQLVRAGSGPIALTAVGPSNIAGGASGQAVKFTVDLSGGTDPYDEDQSGITNPNGTPGGVWTFSAALTNYDDNTIEPTVMKNVLLVAHNATILHIASSTNAYHPHKVFKVTGVSSTNAIGRTATLYLEKTGSKHFTKIGSAKVKSFNYPGQSHVFGLVTIKTTKLVSGRVYIKTSTGSSGSPAATKSKVVSFKGGSGGVYRFSKS